MGRAIAVDGEPALLEDRIGDGRQAGSPHSDGGVLAGVAAGGSKSPPHGR